MTQEQFQHLLSAGPLLLDGATGTHLQAAGMPAGVCPEAWVLDHPAILKDLQRAYYSSGSRVTYTFTFGANRPKLDHHHLSQLDIADMNRRIAAISIDVRNEINAVHPESPVFVAGDLAPTGQFLFPAGDLSLDDLINIYREQVKGLLDAGVDLFVVETMMDMSEARAAVLAIRSECRLPILVSLTVEAGGRTLAGNSPTEGLLTMASLGVDAFGVNCSFGPGNLGSFLEPLLAFSPIPLLIKPNAGLPRLIDGKTVFPMDPESFAAAMYPLAAKGISLLGGCCGTSPNHIRRLQQKLSEAPPIQSIQKPADLPRMICSSRKTWLVDSIDSLPSVDWQDADTLQDECLDASEDDPPAIRLILDQLSDVEDFSPDLRQTLLQLQAMISIPLIFQTENPVLIWQLIRHYHGRPGILTTQQDRPAGPLYL